MVTKYIKPKTAEDNVKVAKNIARTLRKSTKAANLKEKVDTSIKEMENKSIVINNEKLSKKAKPIDSHEDIVEIKDEKYKLKLELINEKNISD